MSVCTFLKNKILNFFLSGNNESPEITHYTSHVNWRAGEVVLYPVGSSFTLFLQYNDTPGSAQSLLLTSIETKY